MNFTKCNEHARYYNFYHKEMMRCSLYLIHVSFWPLSFKASQRVLKKITDLFQKYNNAYTVKNFTLKEAAMYVLIIVQVLLRV